MRQLTVPPQLVGDVSELPNLVRSIAAERSIPPAECERLLDTLPPSIREAPCFLDRLTGIWRYEYGDPIANLPSGQAVLGTHMWPPVKVLFHVLLNAVKHLTEKQLIVYLGRLTDPSRHQEYLSEFMPVLRLSKETTASYEAPGLSDNNRNVDWLIRDADVRIAIDVKSRVLDLIHSLIRLGEGHRESDGTTPAPTHDHCLLFRSVESKFSPSQPNDVTQGAWIRTDIKQEEGQLLRAFSALDQRRVHFVVLGDWEDDAYVAAMSIEIKTRVLTVLNVRESRRFVFRRGEPQGQELSPDQ